MVKLYKSRAYDLPHYLAVPGDSCVLDARTGGVECQREAGMNF